VEEEEEEEEGVFCDVIRMYKVEMRKKRMHIGGRQTVCIVRSACLPLISVEFVRQERNSFQ